MGTRPETYRSSGSLVFGAIAGVGALVLAVLAAVHPRAGAPDWVSGSLVLFAIVVYLAQVRPAVVLGESELVLRNMLGSVYVPWRLVGDVRVRQFLTVEVGEESYQCAAIGRSRRQIYKDARLIVVESPAEQSFGGFVETKIRSRAADARRGPEDPDQEVRVVRAWPEIVLLVAAVLALAVMIVS
jgi:hypothetical protein